MPSSIDAGHGHEPSQPSPVLAALVQVLRASWEGVDRWQRLGASVGTALIAAGIAHLAVLAVTGAQWAGPVSLRKPITFGLSLGVTLVTLAWLSRVIAIRGRLRGVLLGVMAIAAALEWALITMQAWRGVPSHFNMETAFDRTVFLAMGGAISVVGLVIVVLTVAAFARPVAASSSLALAVRAGLGLLVVSQVIGGAMLLAGLAALPDPAAYTAGAVFGGGHAVTLHGVQLLPVLAWLLQRTSWREPMRRTFVWAASAGLTAIAAAAIAEAVGGGAWIIGLAVVGSGLVAGSYLAAMRGRSRRRQHADAPVRVFLGAMAAVWAATFGLLHLAWLTGSRVGLPAGAAAEAAFARPGFRLYNLAVAVACFAVAGAAVALAFDGERRRSRLRRLVGLAGALLLVRSAIGAVQLVSGTLTSPASLDAAGWTMDGVMLLGGVLLVLLYALRAPTRRQEAVAG